VNSRMQQPTFDPGLTQKYTGSVRRIINKDGQFNVRRKGVNWRDIHPYLYMINAPWPRFLLLIFTGYLLMNFAFALVYWLIGARHLTGAEPPTEYGNFVNAFFFSAHTLTTVGYGNMFPQGLAANSVAAVEALFGLMSFALATGLLFGRFSRPAARLGFSEQMIVAPYGDGTSLQFRIANRRSNNLMELDARVLLMLVESVEGQLQRKYFALTLERQSVLFLPLTWTVVHPIDNASPLYGKTAEDLKRCQAEFLILIKGFDDTFYQTLHTRHSYRHDEIVWGVTFAPAFTIDDDGDLVLEMESLGKFSDTNASTKADAPA
jgi:inward rectifier potassium channel